MLASAFDWLNLGALVLSPILAGLVAFLLYKLGRRDAASAEFQRQRKYVVTQLRSELAANARIIDHALRSIPPVLEALPPGHGEDEPVITEGLALARLFTSSFQGVVANDLTRHVKKPTIDRLYDYYAAAARANWLIDRVQPFKYRPVILREIHRSLAEMRDPKLEIRIAMEDLLPED